MATLARPPALYCSLGCWDVRPSFQPIAFARGRRVERLAALIAKPISMVVQIAISVVAPVLMSRC